MRFAIIFFLLFFAVCPAFAKMPYTIQANTFDTNARGVAIDGYDPVAYFLQGEALAGYRTHDYEWKGAAWHFVSEENRRMFIDDPEKYAPQYGGYCAYAVSQESKAEADPTVFTIYNGRLYLHKDRDVRRVWEKQKEHLIALADRNWLDVRDLTVSEMRLH